MRPERLIAKRVVERLGREFSYHFQVEPIMWEREPLVASQHFQENITPPHETDIVVVVLWSRLGVLLPVAKFPGPLSSKPVTGTEWEFEDALKSQPRVQIARSPDVPQEKAPVTGSLEDEAAVQQHLAQKRLVEEFIKIWFIEQDTQSFTAAYREFVDAATFEELFETHLRELLRKRIDHAESGCGARQHPVGIRAVLFVVCCHSNWSMHRSSLAARGLAMSCANCWSARPSAARPLY